MSAVWRRLLIWRYRHNQSTDARTDRLAAEHIDRLEHGIKDSRGPEMI
jgi:hypothetical protein